MISSGQQAGGRRAVVTFTCLLTGFVAIAANWHYEVLRFSSPTLNALALLGGLGLTVVALVIAVRRFSGWMRASAVGLLLVPLAYSLFFGGFVTVHLLRLLSEGGVDAGFEPLGAVPVEQGRVSVYRTNCGATCSFGVAVRHERRLLPGVLLVRRLEGFYPAYQADFEALGPRTIRVSVPAYGRDAADSARSRTYVIDPKVYF